MPGPYEIDPYSTAMSAIVTALEKAKKNGGKMNSAEHNVLDRIFEQIEKWDPETLRSIRRHEKVGRKAKA